MRYLVALAAVILAACGGSADTTAPQRLTPSTLVKTYQLQKMWGYCSVVGGTGACTLPQIPFTSGSLTLRADSTYTLTITPWPSATTYGFYADWWDGAGSGKWHYVGDGNLLLVPNAIRGYVEWPGSIVNGDLVFDVSPSMPGIDVH